jgi:hypothetical protein
VIVAPPLLAGARKLIIAWPIPGVAKTFCGAPGTPAWGVTLFEAVEAAPVPTPLVAVAVQV